VSGCPGSVRHLNPFRCLINIVIKSGSQHKKAKYIQNALPSIFHPCVSHPAGLRGAITRNTPSQKDVLT
jgi:hypothetical protein